MQNRIDTKTPRTIQLGLLVEVLTFLKYVRAFRADFIPGLEALNKELNSSLMHLGVEGYIQMADLAVRSERLIGESNDFQCALTPEALTYTCRRYAAYQRQPSPATAIQADKASWES
ncbi:hypothetical protein [Pseudoduganella sp. R-43]|uniref:hypothetical protein n=1 Tax=Pseudoduganella sp. R-43 TaxID=3404063 RepID=UPI003CE8463F